MRVIRKGHVYPVNYGEYDCVCTLTPEVSGDVFGILRTVSRKLCVTRDTKLFYILMEQETGTYGISSKEVVPIAPDTAAALVEKYVDYETYVKYFGDPEGAEPAESRRTKDLEERLESANSSVDYWMKHCTELEKRCTELERRRAGD